MARECKLVKSTVIKQESKQKDTNWTKTSRVQSWHAKNSRLAHNSEITDRSKFTYIQFPKMLAI